VAEQKAERESGTPATAPTIAQRISALTKETSEALDVVLELEGMGVGDIVADFAERGDLEGLQRSALTAYNQVTAMQEGLRHLVERAKEEYESWRENRRFRPEVVEPRLAKLHDGAKQDSAAAATTWAADVVEALARHEYPAAMELVEGYPDANAKLASALKGIANDVPLWAEGDAEAAVRVSSRLSEVLIERTSLPVETRAQLALLAATANQQAGRGDVAVQTMDAALQSLLLPAVLEAERAGLSLALGQLDDAAQRARHVVELAPGSPEGYFHLGACSEQGGDLTEASELYEEGCARSTLFMLYRLGRGATFLRATGLLHLQRARRLAELGHAQEALHAADDALSEGVAGEVLYPDAPAHELRAGLLAGIGRAEDAAEAAFRAGQQHLRNSDAERAIPLLEQAWSAVPPIPDAGWYYANALRATSWPNGAPLPDINRVVYAKQVWDDRVTRFGLPTVDDAWAYGTRALLSELLAYGADGDHVAAAWEALVYIEKALVLNKTDARMWALCARFLRTHAMDSAALESADHGFTLDPDDRLVLERRLALVANAGRYADAEQTLNRIPGRDTNPYLAGVHAWLLYHRGQYVEAVKVLDLPLAVGNDLGWCLELRASCFVQLGEAAAARSDLEHLLEVEVYNGPISTLRRAMALAELGRLDEATVELAQIKVDDRVTTADIEAVWVAVHLARGELNAARSAGERYQRSAMNVREVDDALSNWRECLFLLSEQGADVDAATQVVDQLAGRREMQRQPTQRRDADSEIEHASEQHAADPPGSHPRIALAAMTARRMLSSDGDLERAEAILRQLAGTLFEPEASIAVTAVLQQRLTLAVSDGNEFQAQQVYEELADRGGAPHSPLEMVIAEALAATGRYDKALNALIAVRARLLGEGWEVLPVDQRIGEYAMRVGDTETSLSAFGRALDVARTAADWASEAQVRARMATALAFRGDRDSVVEHLTRALQALHQAGAVAPSSTLGHELAAVAETTGAESAIGLLAESLGRAAERVDPTDQAGHELLDMVLTTRPGAARGSGPTEAVQERSREPRRRV
jgi:tetratricopeptide (TPR) repeat protein